MNDFQYSSLQISVFFGRHWWPWIKCKPPLRNPPLENSVPLQGSFSMLESLLKGIFGTNRLYITRFLPNAI